MITLWEWFEHNRSFDPVHCSLDSPGDRGGGGDVDRALELQWADLLFQREAEEVAVGETEGPHQEVGVGLSVYAAFLFVVLCIATDEGYCLVSEMFGNSV